MIIRKLILFLLFLSYMFVLGHSIFQHDHHEEDHFINSNQILASDEHSHSADFGLQDIFKRYNHSGDKEIFTISQYFHKVKISKFKFQYSTLNDVKLNTGKSPPYSFLTNENSVINSKKIRYSHSGFRGPPLS